MPTRGKPISRSTMRPARAARSESWKKYTDAAWIATQEMTKMLPIFTSFARTITGNKTIQVRIGPKSQTDGKTIWVVPPIELGTERIHDRALCNKRGYNKILMCSACDAREATLFPLYHEMGHIAFESNELIERYGIKLFEHLVSEWHPSDACEHGKQILDLAKQARASRQNIGIALANLFDPYLAYTINAFEDARVNSGLFRARPGLAVMFDTQTAKLFDRGIRIPHTDQVIKWSDADLNSQVVTGLFLLASGYTVGEGYLSDDAIEVLQDQGLIDICSGVEVSSSANQTFEYAIKAWRRLQELGVCFKEKCKPAPKEGEESDTPSLNNDGSGKKSDEDSGKSGGEPDGSGDSLPDGGSDASGEPSGNDSAGPKDVDPTSGSSGSSGPEAEESTAPSASGGHDFEDGTSVAEPDETEVSDGDDDTESPGNAGQSDDATSPVERGNDGAESDESRDSESEASSSDTEGEADDSESVPGTSGSDSSEATEGDGVSDDADASNEDETSSRSSDSAEDFGSEDYADSEIDTEDDGEDADRDGSDGLDGDDDIWEEESSSGLEDDPERSVNEKVARRKLMSSAGDPELLARLLNQMNCHTEDSTVGDVHMDHSPADMVSDEELSEFMQDVNKALAVAMVQADHFSRSSKNIAGVDIFKAPFTNLGYGGYVPHSSIEVPPAIISQSVLKARVVFEENARGKKERSLKSGRVDVRMLGKRAGLGDDRIFMKKSRPGKRDYFVVIGADCSGSTMSAGRIERIKRAVYAQAELLHRLGIKFAIYGHTGDYSRNELTKDIDHMGTMSVWILEVKSPDAPWDSKAKNALAQLSPVSANLDGHTMEFYRKTAMSVRATDRIIMYYTDGAMPLENYDEEKAILVEEIELCRKDNVTLVGVGIDTDSPKQYGLETCIVRSDDDLPAVVEHLKTQLMR